MAVIAGKRVRTLQIDLVLFYALLVSHNVPKWEDNFIRKPNLFSFVKVIGASQNFI